jgi:guanylate kinase
MSIAGSLFIVSGPSGAGKSALSAAVLEIVPNLAFSVSYTTRPPREGERNGIEYHFVQRTEFEELIRKNHLLEWAEVYGNLYGTSGQAIDAQLSQGRDVLLDIDVQGARSIRRKRPSFQILRERLESRRLDKDYIIEQRLKIACEEIGHFKDYDYLIINDQFEKSTDELRAIIQVSRYRRIVRAETAKSILKTFGGLDAKDP